LVESKTLELLEWPRVCQHLATFAATKLGTLASQRLEFPQTVTESLQLQQQTHEVYELENFLHTSLNFEGIADIGTALERVKLQGVLSGEELLQVATTLAGARALRRLIDRQAEAVSLNQLVSDLRTYPELEQEIHRCIDDRAEVADRASVKLAEIRDRQRQVRDQVYRHLQNLLQRKANAVQEGLITQRGDRFVIPVKAAQKDAIPGIVHDTSASGATLYVEPHATVNLNNQLRQLARQEQTESELIRRQLSQQIAEVESDLVHLLKVITALDLAAARSRYSTWLGGNRPRFIDQNAQETITLRQLRHPLLMWQQQHEQGAEVVPIDLVIQSQIRVVTLTGPNTGGKTATLKAFGLAMLMAKAGLFIPAREPVELPWFSQVLADIGDEQSLQQNLSTFSGHIRCISQILEAINPEVSEPEASRSGSGEELGHADSSTLEQTANCLVLLDEVGAGTDPNEGSALAIALLYYLKQHAQLTLATTHFGELKALKYQDQCFENASVEFDDATLAPTYRLLWGIPGRSNALAIARRLGLKETVIEQAATYLGGSTDDVNQVIAGLEDQRRQQETSAQAAAQLLQATEQLHQELTQQSAKLQAREQALRQQQEKAVSDAITAAKAEVARVIRQLQQGPQTAQDAQQATTALEQIAASHLPSRKQPQATPKSSYCPQVGDRVRIPSLGQTAEVLSPVNADGELTVRFGIMKMTLKLTEIESLTGEKAEPVKSKPPAPAVTAPPPPPPLIRTSQNTVDLRGSRVADAEQALEQAIGNLGSPVLWIIHGHGTGKLRQGVREYLKRHPLVDKFEFAADIDGGKGVTLAYLK
jgi:DNA mismatch repair protein MutS2